MFGLVLEEKTPVGNADWSVKEADIGSALQSLLIIEITRGEAVKLGKVYVDGQFICNECEKVGKDFDVQIY